MNLPNVISLARLLAVPLMVYLLVEGANAAAFWLFVAAGASDAVDGFLAKRLGQTSELGAYLDPLADKALLVAVYVTLGHHDDLAVWLVILVVFRDVMIIGGALVLLTATGSIGVRPLYVSKINTAAQITLVMAVLAELGLGFDVKSGVDVLTYLVAATTVLSGGGYLITWARLMARAEGAR